MRISDWSSDVCSSDLVIKSTTPSTEGTKPHESPNRSSLLDHPVHRSAQSERLARQAGRRIAAAGVVRDHAHGAHLHELSACALCVPENRRSQGQAAAGPAAREWGQDPNPAGGGHRGLRNTVGRAAWRERGGPYV